MRYGADRGTVRKYTQGTEAVRLVVRIKLKMEGTTGPGLMKGMVVVAVSRHFTVHVQTRHDLRNY